MTSSEKQCPVCLDNIGEKNSCVTECGHTFCLKCILRAAQENTACPMCRNVLVDEPENTHSPEDIEAVYEHGRDEGYEEGRLDEALALQEEHAIEKQKAFDDGFRSGRAKNVEDAVIYLNICLRKAREHGLNQVRLQPYIHAAAGLPAVNCGMAPSMIANTQEQYQNLPTTVRAEALRSSPAMAPSWIRNHEAHGAPWQR
jgi:hypothetical protein